MGMVVGSILPYQTTTLLPPSRFLPSRRRTLGDFIRVKRVLSLQLHSDVARIIGLSEDTITNWETNRFVPQINLYPAIFQYLGYYPFTHETGSIGGKVLQLRNCLGLSYEAAGEAFAVNASTVRTWELGRFRPAPDREALILTRWRDLPEFLKK